MPEWFLDPSKASKIEEPVLVPKNGVEELKVEEGEEQKVPVDEPRLEPVEPSKETDGAGLSPVAAQPVSV